MEKKKAIDVFNKWMDCKDAYQADPPCDGRCHSCEYITYAEEEKEAMQMAISALEKQEQDGWIPVTERLPEDDCKCRVTSKNNFGKFVFDCYWNKGKKHFENWNYFLDDYVSLSGVTAWKPIEEPYTEEET